MGSNQKQVQIGQKESFERKLKDRRDFLSGKGLESNKIDKDMLVKQLQANIRAINIRLKAIDTIETKNEELVRLKKEKAASPKDSEGSKKKKVEETPVEAKQKKKKKE